MLRRCASILIAVASLLVSSGARAQTVVSRARLGNNIEDITFISSGRLANNIALMNGYELFVAPLAPPGSQTKLFDARTTAVTNGARGLAYIESQGLLAFHSADSGTLYLVDQDGVFQGTRPMVFPGGAAATYLEGMDYLPQSSPFYPDHLIVVANWFGDDTQHPRIEVVRLDGTVEAEIFPQPFGPQPDGTFLFDPAGYGLLALAYKSPDRLLVTLPDGTNNIWALDFNGNVVGGGPAYAASGLTNFEGIVQLPDGRIIETEYATGRTLFFDQNMNRLPGQDRTYSVGVGLSVPAGVAFNVEAGDYLVLGNQFDQVLGAVPPSLDSAVIVPLVPPPDPVPARYQIPARLTYLFAERLAATRVRLRVPGPPSATFRTFIRLFDPSTGFFNSEVEITAALAGATASALGYIPTTNQFAVGAVGGPAPPALKVVSRTGVLVRTIDLSATGLAGPGFLTFFDGLHPSGGRFLISDGANVVVTDFNGGVLPGGFNIREKLNLLNTADLSIGSTPPAGSRFSLAIVDRDNSEIVEFTLQDVTELSPAHLWIGLKNSDDQGTRFDLKTELLKNGTPVVSGLRRCITGVTRNAADAKEAVVPFDSFPAVPVASGDVLALRVSTRIGTNPDNTRCTGPGGNHNNAAGLRLYYDAASRQSRFDATIGPDPNRILYLRSDGVLNATAPPAGTAKTKDSGGVNFAGGNPYSTIGTWSLAPMP